MALKLLRIPVCATLGVPHDYPVKNGGDGTPTHFYTYTCWACGGEIRDMNQVDLYIAAWWLNEVAQACCHHRGGRNLDNLNVEESLTKLRAKDHILLRWQLASLAVALIGVGVLVALFWQVATG